jgi:DNA-binding GntR family transcriptional regulator
MALKPAAMEIDQSLSGLKLELVEAKSRTHHVYDQMRDRLMRGIFKPHQRLRISELSQAFGTSETPIREAIFQLIRDGAVEGKAHSYYRVRKLSVAEYMERREIRLMLEPLAARKALERISDEQIDFLSRTHALLVASEKSKSYDTAVRANFDFHFGLYRESGMPQLTSMLENLWIQHGPLLNHLYPNGHPTYDDKHQHMNVLDALQRRDEVALCDAIRDDLIEGGRNFVRHLRELEAQEEAGQDL